MFCPTCKYEYKEGVTVCPDCHVSLVEELEDFVLERMPTVTVFSSGDSGLIAMAKSLLGAVGIPFLIKNEGLQDLFVLGRTGCGYNPIIGPTQIEVREGDEEDATTVLHDLEEVHRDEETEAEDPHDQS